MTELSPKARALVEQSRRTLRPSAGDRDRIESLLRERLGPEVLPPSTGAGPAVGFAGARALFRIAVGVCAVGGGLAFMALRPSASPPEPKHVALAPPASAPTAVPLAVTDAFERAAVERSAPAQPQTSMPAPRAPRKRDPFAEELALLGRATQELHLGHAGKALKALEEHQRRFPNGTLSEERRAAKAQALCAIGRVREGRVEQAKLEPQSPAAARAREVCDSASAAERRR